MNIELSQTEAVRLSSTNHTTSNSKAVSHSNPSKIQQQSSKLQRRLASQEQENVAKEKTGFWSGKWGKLIKWVFTIGILSFVAQAIGVIGISYMSKAISR